MSCSYYIRGGYIVNGYSERDLASLPRLSDKMFANNEQRAHRRALHLTDMP